jgi:[acyl-carrier-protein] S-malonyltransferase
VKLAFVFPGQASQEIGMGVALRGVSPAADALFVMADQVTGLPVCSLCAAGPLDQLTRTDVAQTAVVVASMAAALYLDELTGRRVRALGVAGHSVGEIAAMWWAGAIDTETALHLVHERGRLMARDAAACDGTMIAVLGLGEQELDSICAAASEQAGAQAQVANLNAPGQVVLSGDQVALNAASDLARAAGARRVLPLTVGGPFHSVYMERAAQDFRLVVEHIDVHEPLVPIVLNTTAQATTDPGALREELASQVTRSVRWEDSLHTLAGMGCETYVELGPKDVLTGLVRRTLPDVQAIAAGAPDSVQQAAALLAPTGV